MMLFFALLGVFLGLQNAAAEKILAVFAFPGRSHSMIFQPIMKELAHRGHEVTVITNYPVNEKIANYTEVLIEPVFNYWQNVPVSSPFDLTLMKIGDMLNYLYNTVGIATTEYALNNTRVQEFLNRTDQNFDLIIAEQYYQEAFLMLAHKYQVPLVTIATYGFAQHTTPLFGVMSPWSHVPHEFLPHSDKMTFFERLTATMTGLYENYRRQREYLPKQDQLARKYFSNIPGALPLVKDLERNISVMLVNSHVSLSPPRPVIDGLVQVGGLHIKKVPTLLPYDIKDFLDGARHGVIYFSLGSNLKSSDLPPEKLDIFIKVFGQLKERVLWKFETTAKFPKNVMVKKWMPQSDILAHPHVKAFITHGGVLGTQEAIYRAVPMLGIPILRDQHLNMEETTKRGCGILLSYKNLTEVSLKWALHDLLHNPRYVDKVRQMSKLFRDRPMNPLDESIYWIEFVLRHKGAPHLRSSARDLSWTSFMLLDLAVFTVSVVAGILLGVIAAVRLFRHLKKVHKLRRENKKII